MKAENHDCPLLVLLVMKPILSADMSDTRNFSVKYVRSDSKIYSAIVNNCIWGWSMDMVPRTCKIQRI